MSKMQHGSVMDSEDFDALTGRDVEGRSCDVPKSSGCFWLMSTRQPWIVRLGFVCHVGYFLKAFLEGFCPSWPSRMQWEVAPEHANVDCPARWWLPSWAAVFGITRRRTMDESQEPYSLKWILPGRPHYGVAGWLCHKKRWGVRLCRFFLSRLCLFCVACAAFFLVSEFFL